MQGKVVLISDDTDFFEYIIPKLSLRNSDEIFKYKFSDVPEKLHLFNSSLLIVNSENNQTQTLELLDAIEEAPVIVFGFNNDNEFKVQCYKKGMFDYFTLEMPDEVIEAQILPALNFVSSLEKNRIYRDMLVKNNLITKNNEVFLDFADTLDRELEKIHKSASAASLIAISPDEKTKFLVQPNKIETIILSTVRKNDVLMNYASNKYFLLLHNSDLNKANKIWQKLRKKLPEGIYAGIVYIGAKNRQQVINEALNHLHTSMNAETSPSSCNIYTGNNFKFFRQEFNKKLEQIITPVFYQVQQTYSNKLFGMKIEQGFGEGYGVLYIKARHSSGSFRITSPGFSTINIDITYENSKNNEDNKTTEESKRITLEPEELEAGLLQDLLEQFILEFKRTVEE